MSLPTKAEIAALELELGFPFRTAHFTHTDSPDAAPGDTCYYRGDVVESDLKREQPLTQEFLRHQEMQQFFYDRNNAKEDRFNEQLLTEYEKGQATQAGEPVQVQQVPSMGDIAGSVPTWSVVAQAYSRALQILSAGGYEESEIDVPVSSMMVYILCHHDFMGLSVNVAACEMVRSTRWIERKLEDLEAMAPQLFPILSRRQVEVKELLEFGYSNAQMAGILGVSKSTIVNVLVSLRKKGSLPPVHDARCVLSYEDSMDSEIRERF